jgi:hypothetical protein
MNEASDAEATADGECDGMAIPQGQAEDCLVYYGP